MEGIFSSRFVLCTTSGARIGTRDILISQVSCYCSVGRNLFPLVKLAKHGNGSWGHYGSNNRTPRKSHSPTTVDRL